MLEFLVWFYPFVIKTHCTYLVLLHTSPFSNPNYTIWGWLAWQIWCNVKTYPTRCAVQFLRKDKERRDTLYHNWNKAALPLFSYAAKGCNFLCNSNTTHKAAAAACVCKALINNSPHKIGHTGDFLSLHLQSWIEDMQCSSMQSNHTPNKNFFSELCHLQ